MRGKDNIRTAAEILVDQLQVHGVRHVFCVPGESYLAVLDAFHDSDLAVTVCRQEGGAAMMAEAVGKITGQPGVGFVTRGPGATNASPGIHIARQDSTPLVMFVGQVARDMREREAFQEIDYRAMYGSMTKWATEIDDPARIPEIVSRAFGTPKPTLANSYSPELLGMRTFPTLMGYSSRILAESWESNSLYYTSLADQLSLSPADLNVLIPDWTRQTVERIFATNLEDWPALLRSLRLVGDEVREKSRKHVTASSGF